METHIVDAQTYLLVVASLSVRSIVAAAQLCSLRRKETELLLDSLV